MNESYKTYFMLVKKYNLSSESIRLMVATECYFYQLVNPINANNTYLIANQRIKGCDLITLADIVRNLDKLNDFCTSYYAIDCKFKIGNREEVAKKFREVLTLSTFNEKEIGKMVNLVELEEYREYFAPPKEKEKYDEIRRTSDYTYRRCDLLIGKMVYDELVENSDRLLLKKWRGITKISLEDLSRFTTTYCQFYHPKNLKRTKAILSKMQCSFNYTKMEIIQEYISGLEDLEHSPMNYDEQFCIKHNLNWQQLKTLLFSLKFVEKEDESLLDKVLFLQMEHKKRVLKRIEKLLPQLSQQLENGVYVESEKRYRKMDISDYLSQVTLNASDFRNYLLQIPMDREKRRQWENFLGENVGNSKRLDFTFGTSWDYYAANVNSITAKIAKDFIRLGMEDTFFHMPTEEERLEVYYELKKIFLKVSIQMFYRALEVKYAYPKWIGEKETEKIKRK